jgi:hypothetical protein
MMSQTFSLVCHTTKKRIWIGQGWNSMTTLFYSGQLATMDALHRFLEDHIGYPLMLLCNDTNDDILDYEEYKEIDVLLKLQVGQILPLAQHLLAEMNVALPQGLRSLSLLEQDSIVQAIAFNARLLLKEMANGQPYYYTLDDVAAYDLRKESLIAVGYDGTGWQILQEGLGGK